MKILDIFEEKFGSAEEARVFFAPGRVNLIGEHTDYNGGHVFPCALTMGTYGAFRKRADRKIRLYSANFPEEGIAEADLSCFRKKDPDSSAAAEADLFGKGSWTAYPLGVAAAFAERGLDLSCGLDIAVIGNIPAGAGLSSSASLEVMTAYAFKTLYGFQVSGPETAKICQRAENEYVGMNCGIMDQFASAMGKKDHAIFLDTASLEFEYVPLILRDACLIITNTNKKHKLVGSAYNDRRRESAEALKCLQAKAEIASLGELTPERFEELKSCIPDPVLQKRAKHAVYENARTIRAAALLKEGKLKEFGRLMNEAHVSISRDYEVSCRELDTLAEAAWEVPGCVGSRMTGGGFGGCTVSIVKKDAADSFRKHVADIYEKAIGYPPDFYIAEIGGGPAELSVL